MAGKKVLVFHPAVAPYRVDFFNALHDRLGAVISLYYKNLKSQKFDYEKLKRGFHFKPVYFKKSVKIGGRTVYIGHLPLIRRVRPDIVIVGEFGPGMWAAILYRFLAGRKYRILSICDDSREIAEKCSGGRKISRDLGIKYIDGLILTSEEMCSWYREKYGISCVSFPILRQEEEFFADRDKAEAAALKNIGKYDLADKRVFLFVGRLSPEKNIPYLIKSFVKDHSEHPENVLFIIGGESEKEPGLRGRLEGMIEDAGAGDYIKLLGRMEGVVLKAWYYTAQALVLPSTYEPFGAVVNEALLAGEYVMVSDRAGAASLVKDGKGKALTGADGSVSLSKSHNGEVIDISKDDIDFSRACELPLRGEQKRGRRESLMPVTFEKEMDKLMEWLT